MTQVRIVVPGDPHPWGVYRRGKSCKRCDKYRQCSKCASKEKLKNYQEHVQAKAREAMRGRDPHEGPVELKINFFCPEKLFLKADVTNLQKAAEDALKGIIMVDDKQVVHVESRKMLEPKHVCTEIWATLPALTPTPGAARD